MSKKVLVNGQELPELDTATSLEEVEPAVFSVLHKGRSYQARVTKADESYHVEVAGKVLTVELVDPRDLRQGGSAALSGGRQDIKANMPGKVVRLLVAEGETIHAGQGLVVVEAMKMQNEMKAGRDGTVAKISVAEGATVAAGQVLLTLE